MKHFQAMNTPTRRCLWLVLPAVLAACGGGSSDGGPAVTTLSANGLAYTRTMTVTASGSGLAAPDLQMTVEGAPCINVTRSTGATDSQTAFTCTLQGVGQVSPRIRKANGDELARLTVSVPLPLVSMQVRQGTLSGVMVVEIDPQAAPVTALNFMTYVNAGFYRDTLFHRVLPGQIGQGGGYTAGPVFKSPTAAAILLESDNGLKNLRGTLAMARADAANSAQAQFYFNISDNPGFDRVSDAQLGYAVFGKVVTGLEVLDEIGKVETRVFSAALQSLPVVDVVLTSALQTR